LLSILAKEVACYCKMVRKNYDVEETLLKLSEMAPKQSINEVFKIMEHDNYSC
jgi:hypothetical protein